VLEKRIGDPLKWCPTHDAPEAGPHARPAGRRDAAGRGVSGQAARAHRALGAGRAADLLARKLAELASKDLGQPVAVVNRTGAGGAIGYTHVRGQSPDGHALVWNSNSVSTAYRDPGALL
jgi:hypothetical protein